MLTKKQKQDWIEALRSGKFKQGKNFLHDKEDDSYCCLGVLAKINECKIWESDKQLNLDRHEKILLGDDNCDDDDGYGTFMLIGMPKHNKKLSLAKMNDRGYTFEQIADVIEDLPTKD